MVRGDKIRKKETDDKYLVLCELDGYGDGVLWADKWTPDHHSVYRGFPIKLSEEELKNWEIVE